MLETLNLLAQVDGEAAISLAKANAKGIYLAGAALGGGIGIGLIGAKAVEAAGRNPSASQEILKLAIILAALVEGIFIISAFAV